MTKIFPITNAIKDRILVLDGATGTLIQKLSLTAKDFGGEAFEGCNENLVLTAPNIISNIHELYLKAGCDIIETNTFGATPLVLSEYGLSNKTHEINIAATKLAKEAAAKFSTPGHPRFVAGAMGPTTKSLSLTGGISFNELKENFYIQAKYLIQAGADYLLIETCPDTRNVKAALLAIEDLKKELKTNIPTAVSVTIEQTGTLLAGQNIESLYISLMNFDLLYIGMNCSTGPDFMTDHVRTLSNLCRFNVACVPNAGLPDENGNYLETPEKMSKTLSHFIDSGWINVIGGCCGTEPSHIEAFVKLAKGKTPRKLVKTKGSFLSGIDALEVTDEVRPILVGERNNVIGSRLFKDMITQRRFDEAAELAKKQIKNGAGIIDICMSNPDSNELEDMRAFLEVSAPKIRAPLMIDSTDHKVIELALSYSQGKAIINSINLEEGESRFEKIVPLAKLFGAALVVGTIDEDPENGMAISKERKFEIAKRSYNLLTNKYKIAEEDIYFDTLVFSCGTGDEKYKDSATQTIESIKLIKKAFPKVKTILGVSNVSFGLPPAGREVMNSIYLHHAVTAGLDLAIVNAAKLKRYNTLSSEEILVTEDLLFNRKENAITNFVEFFRNKKAKPPTPSSTLPLDTRLSNYILEGIKDGLKADLDEALNSHTALEIINGPLMSGMDEVGKLFNENKLIVAEVLQSAESMRHAVDHLEKHITKADSSSRGKFLLATVKGDVHDIGKNLVEIIFSNNGFEVINLGIKVTPEILINKIKECNPDIIGLSGLLVKSAHQMVTTAQDFSLAGIKTPIIVGGAALSENFTLQKIQGAYNDGPVFYAPDAMMGLDIAKKTRNPQELKTLIETNKQKIQNLRTKNAESGNKTEHVSKTRSITVNILNENELPKAPDFDRHIEINTKLEDIWKFINYKMFFRRHLGLDNKTSELIEKYSNNANDFEIFTKSEPKLKNILNTLDELKSGILSGKYGKTIMTILAFVFVFATGFVFPRLIPKLKKLLKIKKKR